MTEDQFEKLARLINESHEDLSSRIGGLDSRMDSLDSRMDSLESRLTEGFANVHSELRVVNERLSVVEEKVDHLSGVTKEIDYALGQISAIKVHVGMATEA